MSARFPPVDVGAILEAELKAVMEHHAEMARIQRECDRLISLRGEPDNDDDEVAP